MKCCNDWHKNQGIKRKENEKKTIVVKSLGIKSHVSHGKTVLAITN